MEVQIPQQQSVQINLNNKIITLHNVTIVKNPRIVKVDAAQYSHILKGTPGAAPIKLLNGTNNSVVKLPIPSLVPMKSVQQMPTTIVRTTPIVSNNQLAPNTVIVNQTPVIKQTPKILSTQVVKNIQTSPNVANGSEIIHMKPASTVTFDSNVSRNSSQVSPVKIQTIPVKPTVIISPPKSTLNIQQTSPPKVTTNPSQVKIQMPASQLSFQSQIQIVPNQTSVITQKSPSPPLKIQEINANSASVTPANLNVVTEAPAVLPIQTKVIVSPPLKNKIPANDDDNQSASEAKRPCTKLEFRCIFCDEKFPDEPQLLVDHMKRVHPEKMPNGVKKLDDIKETPEVNFSKEDLLKNDCSMQMDESSSEDDSSTESSDENSNSDSTNSEDEVEDEQDDDESEVNDLIMDLEDTQGSKDNGDDEEEEEASSSDEDRSNTPESPEFEEHIPSQNEENPLSETTEEEYNEDEYDMNVLAILLEPFVQILCDDVEENSQEENEAMKLYREAMEINYQQNGIKKRGRRKSRVPKPVTADSMNGILANLLEPNIKIPQGPGRGRRKEVNEEELEMDRSNGICFFQCTQCDKSFKFAGDLAKHVRSHTISSPYRCSICAKVFTHIGSLNTHLRIHSGERPYKCKFCDKSFTQSNSLMVHVKSHLSNKPFACELCNKGFLNASSLALHQKTHTGPTAVTCPIETCGKEFRDNNLLEEHMQTHKQSMLYQCSQCLEKFEQACQLVQHVKSHIGDKPFQCTICSRAFTQPGSLNTHLRIHTGEKPFACTLCPKRFTQASSLSVHMKIHGEKEWKCEICNKSYSQEAFLIKHKQKHKEDESHMNRDGRLPIIQE